MEMLLVSAETVGGEPPALEPLELVAVPSAVREALQLAFGGPGAPSTGKARLWAFGYSAYMLCAAYFFSTVLSAVDDALKPASAVLGVACCISGALFSATVHMRWQGLYEPGIKLDKQHKYRVRALLDAEVTPGAAAALARKGKAFRPVLVALSVAVYMSLAALSYGVWHFRVVVDALLLAAIVGIAALVPVIAPCFFGCLLLDEVARIVVVDRVRLVTQRVRRSTPATADFDGILMEIIDAQHLVSAVAAELARSMQLFILSGVVLAGGFFFLALGPQPNEPRSEWWRQYHMSETLLVWGGFSLIVAIWHLMQPAKVTSACDALGDAINELAEAKEAGEATVRIPTKDQQLNAEYMLRYVRGLNRGHGMGFVIQRKRISYSFVLTMTARVLSAMVFLFPVMLSLTRVEGEEHTIEDVFKLLNSTAIDTMEQGEESLLADSKAFTCPSVTCAPCPVC